jgi:RimJ/RimL family protein N-acetyltransferase
VKRIIDIGRQDDIINFVHSFTGGTRDEGAAAIGLEENGKIIAGVVYDGYNGAQVCAHIAGIGKRWLTRQFLWAIFDYPFNKLKVKRITGLVCSSNLDAQRFDEHLGFKYETRIKDGSPNGDILIYGMYRQDCRFLRN